MTYTIDDVRNLNKQLSKQQSALANDIATQLFNEIKPYITNGKYDALRGYVKDNFVDHLVANQEKIDQEALEAIVQSDLRCEAIGTVAVYTNWLACRIVRQGEYSVPTMKEIDCRAIEDKGGIRNSYVFERVIRYMHAQPELPLLGKIEGGYFQPEHQVFEAWKSCFDWGEIR